MSQEPVLELTEATVLRGETRALDALTLTIRRGEHTAIVGPNGSGKSTLINVLTRENYPLARPGGAPPVRIFGSDRWNVFELRTTLGIVSADLHQRFVEGHSAGRIRGEDAVVSGFFATRGFLLYSAVTPDLRTRARMALARMDVAHLADKALHEMSTGEARRVLIARALVTEPQALVLDEPTAGLDLVARQTFLDLVGRIADLGTTLILVTHHIEEIVPAIDRVVLLNRGRAIVDASKSIALSEEHLTRAFERPVSVERSGGHYYARLS